MVHLPQADCEEGWSSQTQRSASSCYSRSPLSKSQQYPVGTILIFHGFYRRSRRCNRISLFRSQVHETGRPGWLRQAEEKATRSLIWSGSTDKPKQSGAYLKISPLVRSIRKAHLMPMAVERNGTINMPRQPPFSDHKRSP